MTRYSIQASLIGHGCHRGILNDVADAGAKSTVRFRRQSKSTTGPDQARGITTEIISPPAIIVKQLGDRQVIGFHG